MHDEQARILDQIKRENEQRYEQTNRQRHPRAEQRTAVNAPLPPAPEPHAPPPAYS